jgi:GNAT superfamily N-acetyltransferase
MHIEKWNKIEPVFSDLLDNIYQAFDFCDVYFIRDVGFAVLNWQPHYSVYQRLKIPEIQDVFVLPQHRGQGHATSLINHLEQQAGTKMIGLCVPVSGQFGIAQKLYHKLGYYPDGNGVTYEALPVAHNMPVKVDNHLCLMLLKDL